MKKLLTLGLFAFASSLFFGCEKVEQTVDCAGICERYRSCFDDDYDVAACTDKCMDKADADSDYGNKVDECQACIDDESCAAATFKCATDCAGIVP